MSTRPEHSAGAELLLEGFLVMMGGFLCLTIVGLPFGVVLLIAVAKRMRQRRKH
jgi:hypothetical protein